MWRLGRKHFGRGGALYCQSSLQEETDIDLAVLSFFFFWIILWLCRCLRFSCQTATHRQGRRDDLNHRVSAHENDCVGKLRLGAPAGGTSHGSGASDAAFAGLIHLPNR